MCILMVSSQRSGSSTSSWRGKSTSQSTTQSTPKNKKKSQKTDESSYVAVTEKEKGSSIFQPLVPYEFETLHSSTESLKAVSTSKTTAKPEESHEEYREIPDSEFPHLSSPLYATPQASEHSETTIRPSSDDSNDKSKKSFEFNKVQKDEEPELPHLSSPLYATDSTEAAETTVRPIEEDSTDRGKDKPAASFDYKQYHYSTTESELGSLRRDTTTAKSSGRHGSRFHAPYNYDHYHSSTTEGRIPRSSTASYSFGASEKIQTTVKPDDDTKHKFSYSHFTPSWEFSYSKKTHSGEPDFFDHTTPTPNKDAKTSATKTKSANRRNDDDATTTATKDKDAKSKESSSKDTDRDHHHDFFHHHHDHHHHDDHDEQADKEHLKDEDLAPPESYFKDDSKFVEIDNPFADPNFDFDKFLSELKANPIEPTHQTLSNNRLPNVRLSPSLQQRLPQRLVPPPQQTVQPWLQTILQPQALNTETVKTQNPYSFDLDSYYPRTTNQPGKSYVTIPLVAQPINAHLSQANRSPSQELSPPKATAGNLYSSHNRGPQTFGGLHTFDYNSIPGLKAPTLAPFTPVKTVSQPTYIPLKASVKPTLSHEYYYYDDETTLAPKKASPNQLVPVPASNNQNAAAGKKPPLYDDYYYYEYYDDPEGKNNTKLIPAKSVNTNEYYYDSAQIQKLPAATNKLQASNPSVAPIKDFITFPSIYTTTGYLFGPSTTTIRPVNSYDDTARFSTAKAITAEQVNKGQRLTTTTPNLYTDFDSRRDQSNLYNR